MTERLIYLYNKHGDLIFNPFVQGGVSKRRGFIDVYLDEVYVIDSVMSPGGGCKGPGLTDYPSDRLLKEIIHYIRRNNITLKEGSKNREPKYFMDRKVRVLLSIWEKLLRDIVATVFGEASTDKDERQAIAEVIRNRAILKNRHGYHTVNEFFDPPNGVTVSKSDIVQRDPKKGNTKYHWSVHEGLLGHNKSLDDPAVIGSVIRGLLSTSNIIKKYAKKEPVTRLRNRYKLKVDSNNEFIELCTIKRKPVKIPIYRFIRRPITEKDKAYFWEGIKYFPPDGTAFKAGITGKTYQLFPECHKDYPKGKYKTEIYREITRIGKSSFQSYRPGHSHYGKWP